MTQTSNQQAGGNHFGELKKPENKGQSERKGMTMTKNKRNHQPEIPPLWGGGSFWFVESGPAFAQGYGAARRVMQWVR